jgi:hypothetical protein
MFIYSALYTLTYKGILKLKMPLLPVYCGMKSKNTDRRWKCRNNKRQHDTSDQMYKTRSKKPE